jgi:septal ring factor EnvC (AmiA/AmiB activator)
MPSPTETAAILTSVVLVFTLGGIVLSFLRRRKDEASKETEERLSQDNKITALEKSIALEVDRVKKLEEKLEALKEGVHNNDLKLSEISAIIVLFKEAQVSIESDVKELISLVGRG